MNRRKKTHTQLVCVLRNKEAKVGNLLDKFEWLDSRTKTTKTKRGGKGVKIT